MEGAGPEAVFEALMVVAHLPELVERNPFYRAKLVAAGISDAREVRSIADLPFTTKAELSEDQAAHPPFGTNLTYPLDRYVRLHQTSGTTGRPLRLLDTAESWQWWKDVWGLIYRGAGVTAADRIFFCFSFVEKTGTAALPKRKQHHCFNQKQILFT